ncbi:hypothetical protein ElyMa_001995900 [Elysia marginata]|uniref:Uncharacterized protein n=1 Tax=Elysia marginata TaxID=1093978 RepID=A0AAV4F4L0_9GAST|nr:hypothetical protein ElyMa_001995900 [Elysia marginata]
MEPEKHRETEKDSEEHKKTEKDGENIDKLRERLRRTARNTERLRKTSRQGADEKFTKDFEIIVPCDFRFLLTTRTTVASRAAEPLLMTQLLPCDWASGLGQSTSTEALIGFQFDPRQVLTGLGQ